ncbi:type II secretion system protein GspC [Vibrio rumoiensis 1S-45]|uniref:Type II secretion system protein GspC n=2 Tax=Vibrio rumoiensis TaxID=76258 RepID=A0A1E5E648_9VIBR|nr:type II secretion system protein GspC [Vibrio rumoiensis 1S-45]
MASKDNIRGLFVQLGRQIVLHQAQISRWLTLIFTALIAWVIGALIWAILTPAPSVGKWSATAVSSNASSAPQVSNISNLLSANLFGIYIHNQAQSAQKQQVAQDAPQTRLNLTLVGAVSSSNEQLSLAIIANQGKQATYGIGETIENTRATLKAVLIDRVIIQNQGRDETLMLAGIDYNKEPQTIASKRGEPEQDVEAPSDDNLSAIRTEISSDPQKIFQYIRLSQVMEDGSLKGYRVRPGSQRELFDQVGLKEGDIATVLNGKDLTDPSQIASLWKDALGLNEWNLTVERDGQTHDIYIQF